MSMLTTLKTLALPVLAIVVLSGCDSAEPMNDSAGESELITGVTLTLTSGASSVSASAVDPEGSGTSFQIGELFLVAGTTYTGTIEVEDAINREDITVEIQQEAEEHQFFYTPGGGIASRVTVTPTDTDQNALPVGLQFQVVVSAGDAASGTLRVELSHFDGVTKDGTSRGDETDVDLTFPVSIN